jgi:hypothetical protein
MLILLAHSSALRGLRRGRLAPTQKNERN